MAYERPNTNTGREAEANEYYNTDTDSYEVVRQYGAYRVKETFLKPDGKILIFGEDLSAAEPWVVGTHRAGNGDYFRDAQQARAWFARRIAESFKLVIGPPNSVIVREGDREMLTLDAQGVKQAAAEWNSASGLEDVMETAGDELESQAGDLAKRLQRLGVLNRMVYTSHEVGG